MFFLSMWGAEKGKIEHRAGWQPVCKTPGTSQQSTNLSFFLAQGQFIMQGLLALQHIWRASIEKIPK